MRKMSKLGSAIALSLSLVSASYATVIKGGTYNDVDVGVLDNLIGVGHTANCGEKTETDWVNSFLNPNGINVDYVIKQEPTPYYTTDSGGVFAFKVPFENTYPDYFLVKNSKMSALFENNDLKAWGVFDIGGINTMLSGSGITYNLGKGDDLTISHVTAFNTGSVTINEVPVPPASWLFGTGLLGLVGLRKRIKNT